MAPPAGTLRVGRYFLALAILFVVLFTIVFWPGTDHSPKLGLDLRGGAQVIYKAQTTTGKAPSSASMNQAKSIIDQRVNGLGVEQSQVVIQGSDEIVVTVPGKRADELADVGKTALLNFRPLIAGGFAATAGSDPAGDPTASATRGHLDRSSGAPSARRLGRRPPPGAVDRRVGPERRRPPLAGRLDHAGARADDRQPAATPLDHAAASERARPPAIGDGQPALDAGLDHARRATRDRRRQLATHDRARLQRLTAAQQTQIENYKCGDTVSQNPKDNVVVCDHGAHDQVPARTGSGPRYRGRHRQRAGAERRDRLVPVDRADRSSSPAARRPGRSTPRPTTTPTRPARRPTRSAANYVAFTLDDEVISTPTNILGTINGNTQVSGQLHPEAGQPIWRTRSSTARCR